MPENNSKLKSNYLFFLYKIFRESYYVNLICLLKEEDPESRIYKSNFKQKNPP